MTAPARQHAPGPPTGSRSLSPRQRAFVRAYARTAGRAGAAAAAREAGYKPDRAHIRGHRLLRADYILAAIAHQPGGRAALEHLAATARSPHIRTLVEFVTSPDSGIHVVTNNGHMLALFDRSAKAARRYALATRSPAGDQAHGDSAPSGGQEPPGTPTHGDPAHGDSAPAGDQAPGGEPEPPTDPAHGTPAHGDLAPGTPTHGDVAHGTPAHGTPASAGDYDSPNGNKAEKASAKLSRSSGDTRERSR